MTIFIAFGLMTSFNCNGIDFQSTEFNNTRLSYFNSAVFHFITSDILHLNPSPYTFCDLDPINKIDTDGNSPVLIMPSHFELELGELPIYLSGVNEVGLWQHFFVKVENQNITYSRVENGTTQIIPQSHLKSRLARFNRRLENKTLLAPIHRNKFERLKNRFQHTVDWNINQSGRIEIDKAILKFYKVDDDYVSELTNLSAQATSIMTPVHASGSTASGFNSSSHIGVPAATYMGGASVDLSTSACNALPIPSRQLSDATSMQNTSNLFQSRPSAATGANSTTTVGRMRASDNSDQFGDLGFHSNPTLDQVRNMPDPLEESGFYSSPSLEQVLELPIP